MSQLEDGAGLDNTHGHRFLLSPVWLSYPN